MSESQFELFVQYTKNLKKQKVTKESAMKSLVGAKILTKKGNFTKPYKNLAKIFVDKN